MAQAEISLTVEPCALARVLPWLAECLGPKADTSGNLADVRDLGNGGQPFAVVHAGVVVGGFVVQPVELSGGAVLWVTAAAGRMAGVDLLKAIGGVIDRQAQQVGAHQVCMITKRPGIVRKLKRQGWHYAGTKMIKKVCP